MTEHEARFHEDDVKSGNILLAVRPDTDTQKSRIEGILRNSEAHSVN
jgi:hypothetical protein